MYAAYQPSELYDDVHGNFVPFIVLGVILWKRKELIALPLRSWWPGLLILLTGLFFHLLGYRVQQPRISIVGLFVGIYGLTGMAWGPAWLRSTFFPFILFAFCIPIGSFIQAITFPLRMLVCHIVEGITHAILIDIVVDGTMLRAPNNSYSYEVAAACSGIRSLITIFLFTSVYGMVGFKTWWKRGVLIASAIPLAIAGNVLRMLAIVLASEWISPSWGKAIHEGGPLSIYSLIPYVPAFFGVIWLGEWLDRLGRPRSDGGAPAPEQMEPPVVETAAAPPA
jgi:exosortase